MNLGEVRGFAYPLSLEEMFLVEITLSFSSKAKFLPVIFKTFILLLGKQVLIYFK